MPIHAGLILHLDKGCARFPAQCATVTWRQGCSPKDSRENTAAKVHVRRSPNSRPSRIVRALSRQRAFRKIQATRRAKAHRNRNLRAYSPRYAALAPSELKASLPQSGTARKKRLPRQTPCRRATKQPPYRERELPAARPHANRRKAMRRVRSRPRHFAIGRIGIVAVESAHAPLDPETEAYDAKILVDRIGNLMRFFIV